MTGFPGAPRLAKGALITIDSATQLASVITFQYNPQSLTRTLKPSLVETRGADGLAEPTRFAGAPVESIQLEMVLDATDGLETADADTVANGVLPKLAALETLVYPSSDVVKANARTLRAGAIEIVPTEAPLVVFTWGPSRIVPVRVEQYQITEEMHDPSLIPIHVRLNVTLRVLSYNDLPQDHRGYNLFMSYQHAKERLASSASTTTSAGAALSSTSP